MKRRSRAGAQPVKSRRHKGPTRKRGNGPKAVRHSSDVSEETEVARLNRELNEAREQQAATSEVLQMVSSSPGDLQPVFEAMLEKAVRICDATFGNIYRWDGEFLHLLAAHNTPPALAEVRKRSPLRPSLVRRMFETKTATHVVDLALDPDYVERRTPGVVVAVELGGVRTFLSVPMLKENELIGSFSLYRQEVRPFKEKQIALVTNFAAQAVIAIENAQLLNELRQRTTDLTQALEQQTATSEVLQVISSSQGDLEPVFGAMLENAVRICDAKFGNIYRWEADALHLVASHNTPTAYAEHRRRLPLRFNQMPESLRRMVGTKAPIQVDDIRTLLDGDEQRDPVVVAGAELGGIRTVLNVPMLKENNLVGAFIVSRQEVRPFNNKQIELVKNFAAQAVIAIENARLLNELRQRTTDLTERTADLTEALEQQTATSEVLQVISSSPGKLQPVFDAMLANAARLCEAKFGALGLREGDAYRIVAIHNAPQAFADFMQRELLRPSPNVTLGRAIATKRVAQTADITIEAPYLQGDPLAVAAVKLGGYRTVVAVPMLKESEIIGLIAFVRQEVRPFNDKQIALVQNFANQAVIAIENARLLNELRESLEQQTATSEVLQVISSSPGELTPVFQTMLENATRICSASFGTLLLYEGNAFRRVARHNVPQAFYDSTAANLVAPFDKAVPLKLLAASKQLVHITDRGRVS